jgi:hypothetical protein
VEIHGGFSFSPTSMCKRQVGKEKEKVLKSRDYMKR